MKSISRGTKFPRGTPRKLGGHSWDTRQQDCQVLLATAKQQDYHVHCTLAAQEATCTLAAQDATCTLAAQDATCTLAAQDDTCTLAAQDATSTL